MKPKHIIWLLCGVALFYALKGEDPIMPICAALLLEYFELRKHEQLLWTRRRMRQLWAELFIIQHEGLEEWLKDFDTWNKR